MAKHREVAALPIGHSDDEQSWLKSVILRMLALNAILSVAGVGTGVVALYAALTQANATQAQLEASVRPELRFAQSFKPGSPPSFTFLVSNNGSGPGRMRAMRVSIDGIVVTGWPDLLQKLGEDSTLSFEQDQIAGRVVKSGETIAVFSTRDLNAAEALFEAGNRIRVETCYCSVLDSCWIPPKSVTDVPTKKLECPSFGIDQFQQ